MNELFMVWQKLAPRKKDNIFKLNKKNGTRNCGRLNKLPKIRNCNVLASKLRPVKDFKKGAMSRQAAAWHHIAGHTHQSLY